MSFDSMKRDLNCTEHEATLGLSVYALGFGVVPLVTASFSEEFGRQPLYIASGIGFLFMYLMVALYVFLVRIESYGANIPSDQKIFKLSSWRGFCRVRLGRRALRWWEGPSPTYGLPKSESDACSRSLSSEC
jgi:MFS family permease